MTEHHASPSSRRSRTCVTTWDGVRQAKTWPSTGSQLGFSGIWSNTGIWFHDRRHEHYGQRMYSGPQRAVSRSLACQWSARANDATRDAHTRPMSGRRGMACRVVRRGHGTARTAFSEGTGWAFRVRSRRLHRRQRRAAAVGSRSSLTRKAEQCGLDVPPPGMLAHVPGRVVRPNCGRELQVWRP